MTNEKRYQGMRHTRHIYADSVAKDIKRASLGDWYPTHEYVDRAAVAVVRKTFSAATRSVQQAWDCHIGRHGFSIACIRRYALKVSVASTIFAPASTSCVSMGRSWQQKATSPLLRQLVATVSCLWKKQESCSRSYAVEAALLAMTKNASPSPRYVPACCFY